MWTKGKWIYEKSTQTIRSSKENYWLVTMSSFDGAVDNEANAHRICQCVNNFDELLDACKKAFDEITPLSDCADENPEYFPKYLQQAIENVEKGR